MFITIALHKLYCFEKIVNLFLFVQSIIIFINCLEVQFHLLNILFNKQILIQYCMAGIIFGYEYTIVNNRNIVHIYLPSDFLTGYKDINKHSNYKFVYEF